VPGQGGAEHTVAEVAVVECADSSSIHLPARFLVHMESRPATVVVDVRLSRSRSMSLIDPRWLFLKWTEACPKKEPRPKVLSEVLGWWYACCSDGIGVQGAASPHQGTLGAWCSERGNPLTEAATPPNNARNRLGSLRCSER
jgi:hypothetical protein